MTVAGMSASRSANTVHATDVMSRLARAVRPIRSTGVAPVGTTIPPHHHPGRMKSNVIARAAWRMIRGW
jgi:hypothetical protein